MYFTESSILFIAIPIYIIFLNIWIKKKYNLSKIFFCSLIFSYITGVIALTLFPINFSINKEFMINLDLFHSFYDIEEHKKFGTQWKSIREILGNFLLLLPAGFLVPVIFKNIKKIYQILLIGLGISVGIELLQLIQGFIGTPLKIFDVDDIILNFLGYTLGFIIYKIGNILYIISKK